MTTPRDPDSILAAWLEEGPNALPESTARAIAVNTRTMNQRRHWMWMPQRSLAMNLYARIAVAAIMVVAVLGGAVYVLAPAGGVGGGPGSAVPSAPPSPTPSAAAAGSPSPSVAVVPPLDTTGWPTYISTRYGLSIGYPADWTTRPSDHPWTVAADADWTNTAFESFVAPGDTIRASAWSEPVKPGTSLDAWIQTYCPMNTSPCTGIADRSQAATMDGHAGTLVQFDGDTQAFFLVGDRVYGVVVWEDDADPRTAPYGGAVRLLKGYLSTVRLLPGGPASPAPSATPRRS